MQMNLTKAQKKEREKAALSKLREKSSSFLQQPDHSPSQSLSSAGPSQTRKRRYQTKATSPPMRQSPRPSLSPPPPATPRPTTTPQLQLPPTTILQGADHNLAPPAAYPESLATMRQVLMVCENTQSGKSNI